MDHGTQYRARGASQYSSRMHGQDKMQKYNEDQVEDFKEAFQLFDIKRHDNFTVPRGHFYNR